ncbi:DUSP12, partial [Symbiodinium natans]
VPASRCEESSVPDRQPEWTYFCRKCGAALFHDLDVLQHQRGGQRQAGYGDWRADRLAEAAAGTSVDCTSMFVQPMKWMGDLQEQSGRLVCGNAACKQKLGGFSWHGLPCSCGEWQSPAFQIHCARLDCMPARRRARGPAPEAVFTEGT